MNIETANRLYQYRRRMGLSQEELAEKIGVSRQAVSKWERAEASPDTDNLISLAKVYGVTLDELIMSREGEEFDGDTGSGTEPEDQAAPTAEEKTPPQEDEPKVFIHGKKGKADFFGLDIEGIINDSMSALQRGMETVKREVGKIEPGRFTYSYDQGSAEHCGELEEKSMEIDGEGISVISALTMDEGIILTPSEDRVIRLRYWESERIKYEVKVSSGGELSVRRADVKAQNLKFSIKNFAFMGGAARPVMIEVPAEYSGSLVLKSSSGDIEVDRVGIGEACSMHSSSGDIEVCGFSAGKSARIDTSSGDITLEEVNIGGGCTLKSTSGEIEARLFSAEDADISSTSGGIAIENSGIAGCLAASAASGDFNLHSVSAGGNLKVTGASGDINMGQINAGGQCTVSAASGDIEVKNIKAGGGFKASSASGDISASGVAAGGEAELSSTSGDINAAALRAGGGVMVKTTSGDVILEGCQAHNIKTETMSGDVSCLIYGRKSDYAFIFDTVNGDCNISNSPGGEYSLYVSTVSGDAEISFSE